MSVVQSTLAGRARFEGRMFGLLAREWIFVIGGGIAVAVVLLPWYASLTPWVGVGLIFTTVVFGHLVLTSDRSMALPGLTGVAAAIQWIIAPWLSQLFPASFALYKLYVPLDDYLVYAIPATAALWLGFQWPVARTLDRHAVAPERPVLTPAQRRFLDAVIVAGTLLSTFAVYLPWKLYFPAQVIGNFRFFAAACWMLTRTRGWTLRVAFVVVYLLADAAEQTLFFNFVHWGGALLLLFALGRRRRWLLGLVIVLAIGSLVLLQSVKQEYRDSVASLDEVGKVESLARFGGFIADRVVGNADYVPRPFGEILVRFNQGWIVSRIMAVVPDYVPYAGGETIRDALVYSVVPRVLFPGKRTGQSQDLFQEFTGLALPAGTSMGMGPIGEMYANFGAFGGVLGMLVYGSLFGLILAAFARLARRSVLWWALAPLIVVTTIEPGWNIEDITNTVVKSAGVVLVVVWLLPPIRRLLSPVRDGAPASPKTDG